MPEQLFSSINKAEISFKDIIDFLVESWIVIILLTLLGLTGSVIYLWMTPAQYQASAQIITAQIPANNSSGSNFLAVNVEDPLLLRARFKSPAIYSAKEIKACGFENSSHPSELLASAVKFLPVKEVNGLIQLKINRGSRESALACAQAVFESIKASQDQISAPYVQEFKEQLARHQKKIGNAESSLGPGRVPVEMLSTLQFIRYDEMKYLSEEILRLKTFLITVNLRQTKLASPIYASVEPVLPKKNVRLIIGLVTGLILGLIFTIGKRIIGNYKLS